MTPQLKWYYKNREHAKTKAREWQKANPERVKENITRWKRENRAKVALYQKKSAWKRAGIELTHEEYNQLSALQEGKCKLCGKADGRQRLAVDHNHETGEVRGLLCTRCNVTLGTIERYLASPERVNAYLEASSPLNVPKPVPAWIPPPEGYDPAIDGDLDEWCLVRGIPNPQRAGGL